MRYLLVLLLASCANLARVESSIREKNLAGSWRSERGDGFQIGCSGSFSADLTTISFAPSHESGTHLSEIREEGFTVSRFPLASVYYAVEAWPRLDDRGKVTMRAEGMQWTRTKDLSCQ